MMVAYTSHISKDRIGHAGGFVVMTMILRDEGFELDSRPAAVGYTP